jgi:hypothetical protein
MSRRRLRNGAAQRRRAKRKAMAKNGAENGAAPKAKIAKKVGRRTKCTEDYVPRFLEQILCRGRFRHPERYRKTPSVSTVCTRTSGGGNRMSGDGRLTDSIAGILLEPIRIPADFSSARNTLALLVG